MHIAQGLEQISLKAAASVVILDMIPGIRWGHKDEFIWSRPWRNDCPKQRHDAMWPCCGEAALYRGALWIKKSGLAGRGYVVVQPLSHVQLFVTPWTVAH